jgi:hypothetical protein
MGYSAPELIDEIVVTAEGAGTGGGLSAGGAAALGGGALAGAGAGIASVSGGVTSTGGPAALSPSSPTGPSTSAAPGGGSAPPSSSFFGNAVKSALVGGAVNTGTQALMGRRGGVTVPPPPGAAMIDPEGAQAAAMLRARQAVAGGLSSTITGAGSNPGAFTGATSGGKTLLGS